jgi:hypothetical protein
MNRSSSAPPFSRHDVDPYFDVMTTQDSHFELNMSPRDMSMHQVVREIINTPSGRVLLLAGEQILKLRPIYMDVAVVVRNMRRAATVINVPRVYDYGYSGNCSFILMAYIYPAANLAVMLKDHGEWPLRYVEPQVHMIVRKLAAIGLSHNDLYPRNIMVGRNWEILAVVDWDESGPLNLSREYSRRVCWDFDTHHWDYIFRIYGDAFASLDLVPDENDHVHAPLIRFPPGRIIGPLADDHEFVVVCGRESALREYQSRGGIVTDEEEGAIPGLIQYPVRSLRTKQHEYNC